MKKGRFLWSAHRITERQKAGKARSIKGKQLKNSRNTVLRLHNALLETFGGTAGIRDDGLLESALNAPFATFGGQYLYPSVQAKAAQLGFGLVCNHPFVDGNKRIGAHVMLVFLAINGIELDYTQEELIDIILQIASGRAKAADLLEWILYHQA
jgi:death-on-curing protein